MAPEIVIDDDDDDDDHHDDGYSVYYGLEGEVILENATHVRIISSISALSTERMNSFFGSIEYKLTLYENMSGAPKLLELAIPNDDIVQRILSFF
jgi:hypothetical protein